MIVKKDKVLEPTALIGPLSAVLDTVVLVQMSSKSEIGLTNT